MLQCKEQLLFARPGISRLQKHSMLEHCQQLQNTRPLLKPCFTGLAPLQVTQAAANIIRLRPPSVYKGKGIRMADTTPRTKPGKRK